MPERTELSSKLFEIIDRVLLHFSDANIKSDVARKKIADTICNDYYDYIDGDIIGADGFDFDDDDMPIDDTMFK